MTLSTDDAAKVLVVDDEFINRKILGDLLKPHYTVIYAKDGHQALAKTREHLPDLVLLDVMLPGINGHQVLRELKNDDATKEIAVIFITALDSAQDEESGLLLGASDYITKPFNPAIVRVRVANHLQLVHQRKLLARLAHLDGLTGLYNRRRFDDAFAGEWQRAVRNCSFLSLAIVDVDFFKQFNDNYGHAAGDEVLRRIGHTLDEGMRRPADLVARYGGEEFVLLMPDTEAEGAQALAESIRAEVEALALQHAHSQCAGHVTISIGGATINPRSWDRAEALLEDADAMLYRAKHAGRNQVAWLGATREQEPGMSGEG